MLKFGSKSDINISIKCTVRLLDDTEVLECEFQPHHKGTFLLEYVCKELKVLEKDYFGLRYVDMTKQRHWLDLDKTVLKQIKDMDPILFSFRVKFYPPNPILLQEEVTRYQVYLQLKRDLLHGRLYCNQSEAAHLGAFIVQAELGDYDPDLYIGNYISEMKLLLKQTQTIEEKILKLHQTQLKGQSPFTMETHFLKKACQLDTYGVDPHPVKDHRGNTLYLGINHLGVLTFQGNRKTKHFTWSEIQKINYEGKMFIIHLVYYEDSRTKKKHTKSSDAPIMTGGGLFSWGTKFKYSGKTEKEILQQARSTRIKEYEIPPGQNSARKASSEPATPSTPVGSEQNMRDLDGPDEYCFRDSFDRSSCDSQQQDTITWTTLTPARMDKSNRGLSTHMMRGDPSKRFLPTSGSSPSSHAGRPLDPITVLTGPKFTLFQVFIPSFLFVAISLVAATILILESDSDILSNFRDLPEMITLKKHYYQPIKDFFIKSFLEFNV